MRYHTDSRAAPPLPSALQAVLAGERRQDPLQAVPRNAVELEAVLLAALTLIAGRRDEGAAELAGSTLERVAPYLEKRRRQERAMSDGERVFRAVEAAAQRIGVKLSAAKAR